jgi:hypothetical protein
MSPTRIRIYNWMRKIKIIRKTKIKKIWMRRMSRTWMSVIFQKILDELFLLFSGIFLIFLIIIFFFPGL